MSASKRRLGDRRARARFEIVGQLWGSLETVQPLLLHNLGRGGALLESSVALPPDSVHRLRFSIEGQISEIQARIRHVTPTTGTPEHYLIGVEFVSVAPAALAQIDRLVAANLDERDQAAET